MFNVVMRPMVVGALGISLLAGCDEPQKPAASKPKAVVKKAPAKTETVAVKEKDKAREKTPDPPKPREPEKFDFNRAIAEVNAPPPSGNSTNRNSSGSGPILSTATAIDKVALEIRDARKIRDTLVVFVIDRTSGSQMRSDAASVLAQVFRDAEKPTGENPANKLWATVVAYADEPEVLTKDPLNKEADLKAAITSITEGKGNTNTFSTVRKAAEEFIAFKEQRKCLMMMVLFSTKAGSDAGTKFEGVDAACETLKKGEIALFALGASTPFSRSAAKGLGGPESGITESPIWERIELDYPDNQTDSDLTDTGFPPFGIGRLCAAAGGQFFAQRSLAGGMTSKFDPGYFRKYAPDYVSIEKFDALISGNKAKAALVNAAKESRRVEIYNAVGQFNYYKLASAKESDFNKSVTDTQKTSARIDGDVDRLLKMLVAGEGDRPNIKEPRWQANFDLAIGRAYAAKARVAGIDEILATIKGRAFSKPDSDRWIIAAAPSTTSISAIDNYAKKARMYLERVIKEHPNTPWAKSAERELKGNSGNMGWSIRESN